MTVKRQRYLPHAFAARALLLGVRNMRGRDGEELDLDLAFDEERGTLDLRDYAGSAGPIHIEVEVRGIDRVLFEQVLPVDERSDPPLRYLAVLRDATGWYRVVAPLERVGELARGRVDFLPLNSTGHGTLEAIAVRTKTGQCESGYAIRAGMRVASSSPLVLFTREQTQPPGGSLDIRWDDFSTSSHPQRKRRNKRIYYLESTEEPPVLWLNRAITDLPTVLESKGTTGQRAMVRDLINQAIAGPVWYALLHTAMLSVSLDEEGQATVEEGWRRGLLARLAARLYSERNRERGYMRLLERISEMQQDEDKGAALIEQLVAAIQDELDLPEIIRRAMKELAR